MSNAQRIIQRILESDLNPEEFFQDFEFRDLTIAEIPTRIDGRLVYRVQIRQPFGRLGIGYIYQDTGGNQGWKAYEAFARRPSVAYSGRYYLNGDWFPTAEEAAIDLKRQWEAT